MCVIAWINTTDEGKYELVFDGMDAGTFDTYEKAHAEMEFLLLEDIT